ncbi:MAG: hypothetical protein KDN19_14325 [Verrucomicrobiae bacterium]|nr:hypothetical protein [Verrucomicrobiae bacterium]
MDVDVPWHYLALVVIAFVTWLFNRIQEATAERRRVEELKRQREQGAPRSRSQSQPSHSSPPPPLPARDRQPSPVSDGDRMLGELLEALGNKPQTPAPSHRAQQYVPPTQKPAAASQSKPKAEPAARLSASERAALERVKSGRAAVLPSKESASAKRRKHSPGLSEEFRKMLRSPNGLRQAVVMKEILDRPISLRDDLSGPR